MSDPNGGYNNGLNLATAEDQQRSYHQILMGIEQTWNPQGWQHEIEAGERARAIIQIAVAVKDFRVGMDQDQAVYISTAFERSVYEKGTSSSEYRDACRNKLAQIQDSRRRQIAKEEGEWRNQNPEQQQHQGMQQQQGFSPQQLQYSSPLGLSQPQFTQQQQEQYQQQQRHHQQQLLQQQQQQQMQQQQQIQLQQQYNQQRQLLQQQQAQQQAHAQQQAQQQQQQQQQHQQQQPQYQQQQPQQPVFQLSQQQQIERNQIIHEYMNSVAQKMGSPMLHDINQNPTQDIRDLATAWGMAPAQAFLRQQAVMLYRQRVMQQQQQQQQLQMQAQGMNGQNGYSNQ